MIFFNEFVIIYSIYKSCDWIYFFHKMVFEIVLNSIFNFYKKNCFIFLRGKKLFMYIIGNNFKFKLYSCHLDKILIRYQSSKMMFCVVFDWLNKMHVISFQQQVGWLGDKGIHFHSWGSRIDLHEWHGLWSTLECWTNIPYLPSQHRLGVY
jgi:hypothetical protein